jgi:hypothetical protein
MWITTPIWEYQNIPSGDGKYYTVLVIFKKLADDETKVNAYGASGMKNGIRPIGSGMPELWEIIKDCSNKCQHKGISPR